MVTCHGIQNAQSFSAVVFLGVLECVCIQMAEHQHLVAASCTEYGVQGDDQDETMNEDQPP